MKKMKRFLLSTLIFATLGGAIGTLAGCETQATRVSYNMSQEAENFNVVRRLAVLNTRTHKPIFEMIGAFSIKVDSADNQLEIVVEAEPGVYKKHFVGLNPETVYVVEDLFGANVNKYKYEVNFLPDMIQPFDLVSKD